MPEQKSDLTTDQAFIVFFRLAMGWTFLSVGIHHFGDDLRPGLFEPRQNVPCGLRAVHRSGDRSHTDILRRVWASADRLVADLGPPGAHQRAVRDHADAAVLDRTLDFPYIENVNSYLVDYHIVYAGVLVYLIVKRAATSSASTAGSASSRQCSIPSVAVDHSLKQKSTT